MILLYIIAGLLFFYFFISVSYLFVLSFAGLLPGKVAFRQEHVMPYQKHLFIVPAYREDEVIVSTVKQNLSVDYPRDKFDILVVADQLRDATIQILEETGALVHEVSFENSSKVQSLKAGLAKIPPGMYDVVTILDADNVVAKPYLKVTNACYNAGCRAMQARRVAKNLNGNMAMLDGLSEMINNHIYRRGAQNIGLSASLIGSGMSFSASLLQDALTDVDVVGGFDRILQLKLVTDGTKIRYIPEALVYDEKVAASAQFQAQRRRWIASQYEALRSQAFTSFRHLTAGNIDYFHLGFIQNLFLPKYLNLAMLFFTTIVIGLASGLDNLFFHLMAGMLFLHILVFIFPVPLKFYNWKFIKAFFYLPFTLWYMMRSFFSMRGANKKFIHTKHTSTNIDHNLFE